MAKDVSNNSSRSSVVGRVDLAQDPEALEVDAWDFGILKVLSELLSNSWCVLPNPSGAKPVQKSAYPCKMTQIANLEKSTICIQQIVYVNNREKCGKWVDLEQL